MRRPPRDSGLGELLSTLGRCQWESGGSEVVDDDQQTPHARPRRWINCRAISALSRADSMFGPVVCEDVAGQHDPILQRSRASRGCAPVRPLYRGVVIGLPPCSAAGSLASQWRVRIASCCPSRARTTGCAGLPGRASRMPIRRRWRSPERSHRLRHRPRCPHASDIRLCTELLVRLRRRAWCMWRGHGPEQHH